MNQHWCTPNFLKKVKLLQKATVHKSDQEDRFNSIKCLSKNIVLRVERYIIKHFQHNEQQVFAAKLKKLEQAKSKFDASVDMYSQVVK